MSEFRQSIVQTIKEKRPNISQSSIRTYVSLLASLAKQMSGDNVPFFETNVAEILKFLENKPARSRKTSLSALYILTGVEAYRKQMLEDCATTNIEYKAQAKNEKQKEGWQTVEDISKVYNGLKTTAAAMLCGKTMMNYQTMMEFLLVCFLGSGISGTGIIPRRSLDYAVMKIRNFDPEKDNYYSKGKFVFNVYKTSYKFGRQVVEVPKEVDAMLKRWVKLNETDFMLFSSNFRPLSSSQVTRILNHAFGGAKTSTDILRHIFLTEHYKDHKSILEMEQLAAQLGHSVGTSMLYVKKS